MVARCVAALAVAMVLLAAARPTTAAIPADGEIISGGPLTRIIISPDLNCQVAHQADNDFEFYGDAVGACGTFLSVAGILYGPAGIPSGGFGALSPWTAVSQSGVTGSGSGGDPLRIVTVVDAAASGLRIEQADSYEPGDESYRTDIRLINSGGAELRGILYRAGDCYLQDSDFGLGRVDGEAPACVISQASDARIEQWVPITPGSRYFEAGFSDVWSWIGTQQPFPNTCLCDTSVDNGAGLSWDVAIPAGGTITVSHLTFFSPEGRQPRTTLRDSLPGPTDISLDPVVIATSAVIAAGVVALVPFPAALFNSTLEEHYSEVMAAVARFRAWLRRLVGRGVERGRRTIAEVRAARAARAAGPASGAPMPQDAGPVFSPVVDQPVATEPDAPTVAPSVGVPLIQEAPSGRDFWKTPLGIVGFVLLSALLYGLLDPTFGIDLTSFGTFVGLALGLAVMLVAFAGPLYLMSRGRGFGVSAYALPATLAVAIGCVLISRLADFQPGYLYGLIVGFVFTRELSRAEEGRLGAVATAGALVAAVVAWLLLPVVRGVASSGGQALLGAAVETACVTVVVAGLESAVFAMLPLRFLPGERVRAWDQRAWIALLGAGTFAFCHIVLDPRNGYLASTTRTSLFTVIGLLVIFGVGSVLFWAYFRFRPSSSGSAPSPPPAPTG